MSAHPARWTVARTNESPPDYQYRVIRRLADGSVEVYQYADTRAEAAQLARDANGDSGSTGVRS